MKLTESTMVWLKAAAYFLIAFLTPLSGLLATAADANTMTWPKSLQIASCLLGGFIAGLVSLRAYFDGSNARFEANQQPDAPVVTPPRAVTSAVKAAIIGLLAFGLLGSGAMAQTQPAAYSSTPAPTVSQTLKSLYDGLKGVSNLVVETHAMYAPSLEKHAGGGIGIFYPANNYLMAGTRLDYVDGGFWMPSGNVTLKVPITPFSSAFPKLVVSPFAYSGVGIPVGKTCDNNGQATGIVGYGASVEVAQSKDGNKSFYIIADREQWSGFRGEQYRVGMAVNVKW